MKTPVPRAWEPALLFQIRPLKALRTLICLGVVGVSVTPFVATALGAVLARAPAVVRYYIMIERFCPVGLSGPGCDGGYLPFDFDPLEAII